jgi:hypothetical protein
MPFLSAHGPRRDDSDFFTPNGKYDKEQASSVGLPQYKKTVFRDRMGLIAFDHERAVKEHFLAFRGGDIMFLPTFLNVAFVPFKPFDLRKDVHSALIFVYIQYIHFHALRQVKIS